MGEFYLTMRFYILICILILSCVRINPSFEKLTSSEKQAILDKFEISNNSKYKFIDHLIIDSLLNSGSFNQIILGNTTCPNFKKLTQHGVKLDEKTIIIDNSDIYHYSEYNQFFDEKYYKNSYFIVDTLEIYKFLSNKLDRDTLIDSYRIFQKN